MKSVGADACGAVTRWASSRIFEDGLRFDPIDRILRRLCCVHHASHRATNSAILSVTLCSISRGAWP